MESPVTEVSSAPKPSIESQLPSYDKSTITTGLSYGLGSQGPSAAAPIMMTPIAVVPLVIIPLVAPWGSFFSPFNNLYSSLDGIIHLIVEPTFASEPTGDVTTQVPPGEQKISALDSNVEITSSHNSNGFIASSGSTWYGGGEIGYRYRRRWAEVEDYSCHQGQGGNIEDNKNPTSRPDASPSKPKNESKKY